MPTYLRRSHRLLAETVHALISADLSCYDSVPALAKKAGTNPSTLKQVFYLRYGVSVFTFSRLLRIEAAKKLLLETEFTLQTIAAMLGYSEGNNFQVSFKTVVGCTPGEWRKGGGVVSR